MKLPAIVLELSSFFLEAADSAAPGLIQGLYLIGSVALDDFQEHSSDVDFVAVSKERTGVAELLGLARAHESVRSRYPRPNFDGPHLTWSDLAAGPQACALAPFIHEGRFEPAGQFAINPVTWYELAHHSVSVRGQSLVDSPIWQDPAALRAWCLNNLVEYWRPWVNSYHESPAAIEPLNGAVVWGVLGVARLHYTLATGEITSKTGAGQYALRTFGGRWTPIISEALRIRSDPAATTTYLNLSARRRDVAAFMEMVIAAAG